MLVRVIPIAISRREKTFAEIFYQSGNLSCSRQLLYTGENFGPFPNLCRATFPSRRAFNDEPHYLGRDAAKENLL